MPPRPRPIRAPRPRHAQASRLPGQAGANPGGNRGREDGPAAHPGCVASHPAGRRRTNAGLRETAAAPRRDRILPQDQRQADHGRRSGHHRVPVTGEWRRWGVLGIFVLSSAINYLDRQSLATMAPPLREEFHLSYEQYGLILTAFSITYAVC